VVPPWETQKVPYDQQWLMPPYRGPRMLDQIAPSNDALRLWTEPAQAAASPESVMRIRSRRRPS
jgi:hypothetical protein